MSSKLEELKRKREEMRKKNDEMNAALNQGPIRERVERSKTPVRQQPVNSQEGNKSKSVIRYPINASSEVVLLSHKQDEKKITLEEGIMVNFELDHQKLHGEDDYFSNSSEADTEIAQESKFSDVVGKFAMVNRGSFVRNPLPGDQFRQLANDELEVLFRDRQSNLILFFKNVERMINGGLGQNDDDDLIEDYIFNQDKDVREQKEGCTVKKLEDQETEGKYMVNDIMWMKSNLYETEKVAVCYSKLTGIRDTSFDKFDYFIGVYSNERRVETKTSRSEIKKICADDQDDSKIFGGLDNGRVAIWDIRTEKANPDLISKITEKANYLPIIDIKKRSEEVFTVGLEGRICKWDARKLEEPLFSFDLLCVPEGNSLAQLEAMPMSLELDPADKEILFVTTFEGSIYELMVNPNNFQQRSFFADIHTAPITRLSVMDFKSFFREQALNPKNSSFVNSNAKFINHFLTCSFDWDIKLFKGSLANEIHTFRYHNDFVTSIDINNTLCPFTFASGDAEGKLAVWKLDSNSLDVPIFEWANSSSISRLNWNFSGTRLAVGDVKGGVNILTFPKSKLLIPERTFTNFLTSGLSNLKKS
jgi:WD40 repeat protein